MTETIERLGPAYRVETERLVLRCWNPEDASLLKAAIDESVEHLRPWLPWVCSEPEDLEIKVERLRRHRGRFDLGQDFIYGVFDVGETAVLGACGLHTRLGRSVREIGYWIHADHVGQGLATELSAALTKVAFEIDGVERVEIQCGPKNTASAAVPRKLGYTHDATLRSRMKEHDGSLRDTMIWSMLAMGYLASPSASTRIEAFDAAGQQIL